MKWGTLTRYISVYAVKTRAQTKVISISDQVSPAHKTQYTTRAEAAAVMVKKRCHDAGRLAAPERAGEGAGVLEAIPVPAATGDPEGAGDDGDWLKNGAPADGSGTKTAWKTVCQLPETQRPSSWKVSIKKS